VETILKDLRCGKRLFRKQFCQHGKALKKAALGWFSTFYLPNTIATKKYSFSLSEREFLK